MTDEELKKRKRKDVAEDGEVVRLPLIMMDATAFGMLADQVLRREGFTTFDASKHRPGYVQLGDAEKSCRERLYRDHDKILTERWKTPTQQVIHDDAIQSGGSTKSDAYAKYERRLANAWRHQ